MNTTRRNLIRHELRRASAPHASRRRRGSVLVVVLALLSALMLLGFLFYTSASQERANARYFAQSEKNYATSLEAEELFDFALEQVIVGPRDDYVNSALWGGRYSLLANFVGTNMVPYNGPGVNVVDMSQFGGDAGVPGVNQDYNNTLVPLNADADTLGLLGVDDRLTLNMAGWTTGVGRHPALTVLPEYDPQRYTPPYTGPPPGIFPEPDTNYTYPDMNSVFLALVTNEPLTGRKVIIPSFHRPQYLRGYSKLINPGAPASLFPTWYTDEQFMPYMLRPHTERKIKYYDYNTGQIVESSLDRFLPAFWDNATPTSTDPDPNPNTISTLIAEGDWNQQWVTHPDTGAQIPQYDVDANNDGVKEAILLDLDHPVEETPDGTQQFIPMFAITIFDLDALFNLNAHGNLYGAPSSLFAALLSPDPSSDFLSQSNEGRHRHEINPELGLTAGITEATNVHLDFFGHSPTSRAELANMEFWFILAGRVEETTSGDVSQIYKGRWGEAERLKAASLANNPNPFAYPRPGVSNMDDARTSDGRRGLIYRDTGRVFPKMLPSDNTLPFWLSPGGHPEDHQGQGRYVANTTGGMNFGGVTPLVSALGAPSPGRISVLRYVDYWFPTTTPNNPGPAWVDSQLLEMFGPAAIVSNVAYGLRTVPIVYGTFAGYHIDNPGETILDAFQARSQITDSTFGAEETAALHLAKNDYDESGIVSRLLELVPANFKDPEIRGRYTTVSRDLKAYGNAVGKRWVGATPADSDNRAWENGLYEDPATEGFEKNVFPPFVASEEAENQNRNIYGFRPEARGILQQQGVMPARRSGYALDREILKGLIHKLSVNHVAAQHVKTSDGRPQYFLRPLTPHPIQDLPREELPAPNLLDADGANRLPATLADELGDPMYRAHFGMPDSWVIQSGIPTWRMNTTTAAAAGFTTTPPEAGAAQLQEWHARRDRQNMARDIYTLLYVFGHVNANFNPMTTDPRGATPGYTNAQMREMAQFAVNVVDAMDPDDTITLFVYDKNLADGYTLLDSGYGTLASGDPAAPPYNATAATLTLSGSVAAGTYEDDNRGMVFGVEAQQLAFSEVLAVLAKEYDPDGDKTGEDHEATLWKDDSHRDYIFTELQNMTPRRIPMGGGWSIVCQPVTPTGSSVSHMMEPRSLTILDAADVEPGKTYTIGTAGDEHLNDNPPVDFPPTNGTFYDSYFRVDKDSGAPPPDLASFEMIAPSATGATLQFDPINEADTALNINTLDYDPVNDVLLQPWSDGAEIANDVTEPGATSPSPQGGAWLHLGTQDERDDIVTDSVDVVFTLRRRANLHRQFPTQDGSTVDGKRQRDNPWIEVDVCRVDLRVFDLSGTPVLDALQTQIISEKRVEPLDRSESNTLESADPMAPDAGRNMTAYQTNSLGGYHPEDLNDPADIWQHHYDRSFASIAGVLQVPLYGPQDLTATINSAVAKPAVSDLTSTAMARFLFPDGEPRRIDVPTIGTQIRPNGNLWYRALAFLEVPEKYGNPDGWPWFVDFAGPAPWGGPNEQETLQTRRYGKINLNTQRYPHVLGGLLDDQRVMTPQHTPVPISAGGAGYLPSANNEIVTAPLDTTDNRDWWLTMLASRDGGIDPLGTALSGTRVILPGVPAANPFKGLSVAPVGVGGPPTGPDIYDAFSQTMLRTLGNDYVQLPLPPTVPYTPAEVGRRSVFELGNQGGALGSTADLATRYRLLGKVLKHGTTRSNSYVIFMTCDFYEAEQAVDGAGHFVYQIGKKMPADSADKAEPRYRGVFVVDRTLALEMLQKRDLPPTSPRLVFPRGSRYRTFSFAREPGANGQAQPTFDWRKLILYRNAVKSE